MTTKSLPIFDEVQMKLQQIAGDEILAKSSVSVTTILSSLQWKNEEVDLHYDLKITVSNKKKKNLIRLALLSYEVPEELGYYLRLSLSEIAAQRIELSDLRFILKSKRNSKLWLLDLIERKTSNQIFGNFFDQKEWNKTLSSFRVQRLRNHKRYNDSLPSKRMIGVGYRDKGTLPNSTSPGSLKQFQLTSLQNRIEEGRQASDDLDKILEGFFW